jgi:hypothetical protein
MVALYRPIYELRAAVQNWHIFYALLYGSRACMPMLILRRNNVMIDVLCDGSQNWFQCIDQNTTSSWTQQTCPFIYVYHFSAVQQLVSMQYGPRLCTYTCKHAVGRNGLQIRAFIISVGFIYICVLFSVVMMFHYYRYYYVFLTFQGL